MTRTLSWFSCGAASAIATMLVRDAEPVYCETHAEHPDSERFLVACEAWFGRKVTRISSDQYVDTWDVWQKRKYLAGVRGAPCTLELKIKPRLAYQRPTDVHVFGYTADTLDVERAERLRENYPELTILTPLIERKLTKAACLEMLDRAHIPLPLMYTLGFHNNNCIPCVKATSPSYWALIRQEFPMDFDAMATLSRSLGARLTRLKGVRSFIDEIPLDHPTTNPIQPSCDFLCHLAEMAISEPASD